MGQSIQSVKSVLALVAALLFFAAGQAQAQNLTINNVMGSETTGGTTTFTFTVSLDAPAGLGGVAFDIATANGTATTLGNDYVGQSLAGQGIPQGQQTYDFVVTVNGDSVPESNETFFVNVTNVTGAAVADGQGLGTIVNDDLTPIHDIQGPGASSPIVGAVVSIRGIVTGVKSNGFFVQEEDAEVDADPATSEAIFVFTSSAPPADAAFSAQVHVIGTVTELVPGSDPQQPPVTQLDSPSAILQTLPPGQTLPSVVLLNATFPDPAGPFDQLERVEHMRVSVASLTVVGPTGGAVNQVDASAASTGTFYGVVTGVARPFREAGIQAPDTVPSGTIPPIPRWDSNPERIRVDSRELVGQPTIDVTAGDVVGPLVGPLDYSRRAYSILPDGTDVPTVTPGTLTTTVTSGAANEVTVASINLRRLFDTVADPYADTTLTPAAFDKRLAKASIAIRAHLHNPDIIGVQEVEKLDVLQALAARILADGGPPYDAYLVEGNDDIFGLDVGFLVKTNQVDTGVPRVEVVSVTQQLDAATWIDPVDNQPATLFDRPPLLLQATVNRSSSQSFPIVVVVSDLIGLTAINDESPDGLTTIGDRVRRKRLAQAQALANLAQTRQTNNPAEHLVVLGSFNAYEVNDGYTDVMNTVTGAPPPDNETVVPADGIDLVNPDLVNLYSTPPAAQRYSTIFDGNANNVDHVLVNQALIANTAARRIEHPRIAADYRETEMNDDTTALRFSDRDPVIAYFSANSLNVADLQVTNVDTPDPVFAGQNVTHTITVTNAGTEAADTVSLSDTLSPDTTFVSLTAPGGWSCTTPAVGASGTVSCSIASMPDAGSAVFTLVVTASPSLSGGAVLSNAANVSSLTSDPSSPNNSATATTTVTGAPAITDITNQVIDEDTTTGAVPFTIGDAETSPENLIVTFSSSDQSLVPNGNITIGGTGANRTITVAPLANQHGGPVLITVTVTDEATLMVSDTFTVTVNPVNDAPTISAIANQSADANETVGPFTITVDDIDHPVAGLTLSATSSNQALVTNAGITFGGSGAQRTITITPVADQGGQTTITVTVSDGVTPTSTSFVLTVTPPPTEPTALKYFLAEGATGTFFNEDVMIANPNTTAAPVTITYFREGLTNLTETRTIPARSGVTLHLDTMPGLEAAAVSVEVSSDEGLPLAVERTMFWGEGSYGGHTESAQPGPATRWYFAEGSQGFFDTFVLLANPQSSSVDVTLTFLREGDTNFTTTVQVDPFSRKTISTATIPEVVNRSFAIIVDSTQPIAAERAMYFGSTAARPFSGGAAAAGVTAPSATWLFAEGATGSFFDTFILLMNPENEDAHLTLRYLLESGEAIDVPKVVPARGRLTVNIETEDDPRLQAGAMSAFITSDRPIVAERSVYWPTAEGALPWGESHVSQGTTAMGSKWALAEGRAGGPLNFRTYVTLMNPGTQPAEVTVEFLPESGAPIVKTYMVAATSRFTLDAVYEAPALQDKSFATVISTSGNAQIMVERSLYWDGAGIMWSGGSNAAATRLPVPE